MTTPFELAFRTREGVRSPAAYARQSGELASGRFRALSMAENQDISVSFRAPAGFRLTMDGMDVVSGHAGETAPYLSPRAGWQTLFEAKNFPLVPGYYGLTVEGGGRAWHTLIEIVPRYLEKQQWTAMRDELTEEIRHLSFDFMKRSLHIGGLFGNEADSALLLRFYIIHDTAERVIHVLRELSRSANSRIAMKTKRVPRMSVRKEEPHSRPLHNRIGQASPFSYVTAVETTWNVAENRFVKTLLLQLSRSLSDFMDSTAGRMAKTADEQESERAYRKQGGYRFQMREGEMRRFSDYRKEAERLQNAIRAAADAPWYRETEPLPRLVPDMTLARDPRYAVLYRLYENLRRPEDSLSVSSFYRFQWKRTDKLYELWCVLTFVKAFSQNGWQMENGPAVRADGGQYLLESLEPGAVIVMSRDEERVRMVYDADIPKAAAATNRETEPLYTNAWHRRPDLRIDHYRGEIYDGSLIVDFKYRDIYRLWQDETVSARLRSQFNAYRDMNTKFYRDLSETDSLRNVRPVKEVWAVFPREAPPLTDEDYSLRFLSLAPGLAANAALAPALEAYFEGLGR